MYFLGKLSMRVLMLKQKLLVGECSAFLASGSDPTVFTIFHSEVPPAEFQLLI